MCVKVKFCGVVLRVRSVMFAADSPASKRCTAVYLLDCGPVCDEAVGVWREGGSEEGGAPADRMLTSWVLPLETLQTSRKHTHRQIVAHTLTYMRR